MVFSGVLSDANEGKSNVKNAFEEGEELSGKKFSVFSDEGKINDSLGEGEKSYNLDFEEDLDIDIKRHNGINIRYLDDNTNLDLKKVNEAQIDNEEPFGGIKKFSESIKEKVDFGKFLNEIEKIGEDVARYKWAFDEGNLGSFDGKKFTKEVFKAGVRGIGANNLRMVGNMFKILGKNLDDKKFGGAVLSAGGSLFLPKVGELFNEVGDAVGLYADKVENLEILAPDDGVYEVNPNWMSLANVLGQSGGSVLAMGGASKIIGSRATYGLFAIGGSGDVFDESIKKDGNIDKANALVLAKAGSSYAIDRIFNPLPEVIEQGIKKTSSDILKEMFGAPLRELGSEMLQQVFSENLVRKIGIDDTQLLFEGMIESAIGAMAGNMVVAGVDGGVYFADKGLNEVEKRILLKGVSKEELQLYKTNILEFMKSKPEAFDKILGYNIKQNVKELMNSVEGRIERKELKKEVDRLPKIYDLMYQKLYDATNDEGKARSGARMFEANALFFKQLGLEPSYLELVEGYLPNVKKQKFSEFLKDGGGFDSRFQFGGLRAKNIDYTKVGMFKQLEEAKVDPQIIWKKTGIARGSDGKLRFEISDEKARIKLWDDEEYNKRTAVYQNEVMHDLELLKMQLAYSLTMKKGGSLNSVFSDFYNYLKKNDEDAIVLGKNVSAKGKDLYVERENFSSVIDEAVELRREFEEIVLSSIIEDFYEGRNDVVGEEKGLVMEGIKEKKRFDEFYKKYWTDMSMSVKQKLINELNDNPSSWVLSDEFVNRMNDLESRYNEKRKKREKVADDLGIAVKGFFFKDIDLEETYLIKRAMEGDVLDKRADKDYRPYSYNKAYLPHTKGEKFLESVQYDFFDDIPKRVIASYLDRIEQYYRLEKYINAIKESDKKDTIRTNRNLKSIAKFRDNLSANDRGRIEISNGKKFKLDDVLEHEELFSNYPDLKNSNVLFTRLNDDEPYHFYFDKDKGYVFEFDADQLDRGMFTELLIKGTSFAVQHKEGFDCTLNEKQRKNYMDRSLYVAKKIIEKENKEKLTTFLLRLGIVKNEREVKKFWKESSMPVSMLNIYASESIDGNGDVKNEKIKFGEIDFDKVLEEVKQKFPQTDDKDKEYIRKVVYSNLYAFKEKVMKKVMFLARVEGGYHSVGLPWGGVVSQGKIDERALFNHRIKRGYLPRDKFITSSHGEYAQEDFKFVNDGDVMVNIKDEVELYEKDEKAFKFINQEALKGAYDFKNNVISLFGSADSETIVHESFHYFYNFLKNSVGRDNLYVGSLFEIMDEIKTEYVKHYDIKEHNGFYYATFKGTNEVIDDNPVGYKTRDELLEAVSEEILVERFLRVVNGKPFEIVEFTDNGDASWSKYGNKIDEYYKTPNAKIRVEREDVMSAIDLYSQWFKTMCKAIGVSEKKSGKGGKKIFMSLFNKKK